MGDGMEVMFDRACRSGRWEGLGDGVRARSRPARRPGALRSDVIPVWIGLQLRSGMASSITAASLGEDR
jgi:hypothetical protein